MVFVGESAEDLLPADPVVGEVDLWVPNTVSPHATWAYSRMRPSSLSRRKTRVPGVSWRPSTLVPASGAHFPEFGVSLRSTRAIWQVYRRYTPAHAPPPPPPPALARQDMHLSMWRLVPRCRDGRARGLG